MNNVRIVAATFALAAGLIFTGGAQGEPIYPVGNQSPVFESYFTLEFPAELGGSVEAGIATTNLVLRLDESAQNSRFLDYTQSVAPLTLPGGFSTGPLTIEINSSISDEYDPASGEFNTLDEYLIHFTEDLSAFGIVSPFVLTSASNGTVDFIEDDGGNISMTWNGSHQLDNPFDPSTPIPFQYTCVVNTEFILAERGDYDGDSDKDLVDFAKFQTCYSGTDTAYGDDRCELFDFDQDEDIDLADFSGFSTAFTGPVVEGGR